MTPESLGVPVPLNTIPTFDQLEQPDWISNYLMPLVAPWIVLFKMKHSSSPNQYTRWYGGVASLNRRAPAEAPPGRRTQFETGVGMLIPCASQLLWCDAGHSQVSCLHNLQVTTSPALLFLPAQHLPLSSTPLLHSTSKSSLPFVKSSNTEMCSIYRERIHSYCAVDLFVCSTPPWCSAPLSSPPYAMG
jgi:hypothetical protein